MNTQYFIIDGKFSNYKWLAITKNNILVKEYNLALKQDTTRYFSEDDKINYLNHLKKDAIEYKEITKEDAFLMLL